MLTTFRGTLFRRSLSKKKRKNRHCCVASACVCKVQTCFFRLPLQVFLLTCLPTKTTRTQHTHKTHVPLRTTVCKGDAHCTLHKTRPLASLQQQQHSRTSLTDNLKVCQQRHRAQRDMMMHTAQTARVDAARQCAKFAEYSTVR